ncbi:MAG: DUF3592 domain-containing protein [Firmicutes bacterium]|nr:DUF3592 domain-containing protein [Bacillota bacterium]
MNKFIQLMQATTLGRFLIPGGLMLLIFGLVTVGNISDARDYKEVSAVVSKAELVREEYTDSDSTHHDAEYDVTVKYTVNGREYESELGVLSNIKAGDNIKVFYNPEDPGEVVQMRNQALIPYICIGVGALALIGGIISIVKAMQKIKRLRQQEEEWGYGN